MSPLLIILALLLGSAATIYFACEFFVNGVEWVGRRMSVGSTATATIEFLDPPAGGPPQLRPSIHRETPLPLGSLRTTPESQVRSHVFNTRPLLTNSESLKVI